LEGPAPTLTQSEWLSYATMAIRGPRCVEPSVLAKERPSDRLQGSPQSKAQHNRTRVRKGVPTTRQGMSWWLHSSSGRMLDQRKEERRLSVAAGGAQLCHLTAARLVHFM